MVVKLPASVLTGMLTKDQVFAASGGEAKEASVAALPTPLPFCRVMARAATFTIFEADPGLM